MGGNGSGNPAGRPNDGETFEEIRFLEGLGNWYEGNLRDWSEEGRRLRLLRNYRDSMPKRVAWGKITVSKIAEAVYSQIEVEQGRMP